MKLSNLAIQRPVATLMVVLLILLLGAVSLSRLNIDLFPNMSFPVAAVITSYEGVGPEEIENLLTRPLENVLGTVTNLKQISSISRPGQSVVILEFNWNTNMDFVTLEMREKIDLIKGRLPEGVTAPMVFKFDPSMLPIAQFGLSGIQDLVEMKRLAEQDIIPRLERIDGVASVGLTGGLTREIRIEVDQKKLAMYELDLQTISTLLQLENLNLPAGRVSDGRIEYLVRTTGEFASLDEIRGLLLPSRLGLVKLGEIGEIRDTFEEVREMARMNGEPSVGITIQKQADANTVRVTRAVLAELARIEAENENVTITPIMNQSQYIEESINNVSSNAITGGILAVLILFLFLRNIRSTLVIGVSIPVSIITTFILMYFNGLTLNLMSLGGLALGVGMLVDNSIVVLENIFRFRQNGLERVEAAKKGSSEVTMAIIASTLTTIIVFLPVFFVEGIASQLFGELALTVTFSLLASLVIAMTLIPMLSSQILTLSKKQMARVQRDGRIMEPMKRYYRRLLHWAMMHPWLVFGVVLGIFGISLVFYPQIGTEFIPDMDQGEIRVNVQLPLGTIVTKTDQIMDQVENAILQYQEVESVFTSVGSQGDMMMESTTRPEAGELLIRLKPLSQRQRSTTEVMEALRKDLQGIRGAKIQIESQGMVGSSFLGKPVVIEIRGSDLRTLMRLVNDVVKELDKVEGIREIEHTMQEGRPEIQIKVDRAKAAQFGLRAAQVAMALKNAVQGDTPTRYKVDGNEYDLRIQLKWDDRKNISELKNILLTTPVGLQVPLGSVAELVEVEGPGQIDRSNGMRMIEVTADLYQRDLGSANAEIQRRLKEHVALPDQYTIEYGGQYKEMWSAFDSLTFALILAIVLVYMVLAAQFESLMQPLTIMFTLPLALTGVIFSLLISGHTWSVLSLIGVIMLAGIVVNNAIVLVDYINTLRSEGKDRNEAIMEAGPIRLRPILMTSLTTVLGLLPLALGVGEGAETQAPLAIVVIGGLTFSTFLTLIVVPVVYLLMDRLSDVLNRQLARFQKG